MAEALGFHSNLWTSESDEGSIRSPKSGYVVFAEKYPIRPLVSMSTTEESSISGYVVAVEHPNIHKDPSMYPAYDHSTGSEVLMQLIDPSDFNKNTTPYSHRKYLSLSRESNDGRQTFVSNPEFPIVQPIAARRLKPSKYGHDIFKGESFAIMYRHEDLDGYRNLEDLLSEKNNVKDVVKALKEVAEIVDNTSSDEEQLTQLDPHQIWVHPEDGVKILDTKIPYTTENGKTFVNEWKPRNPDFIMPERNSLGLELSPKEKHANLVWAVAANAYRVLGGTKIYDDGEEYQGMETQVKKALYTVLAKTPSENGHKRLDLKASKAVAVFEKAFDKEFDNRFSTATEMIEALEMALFDEPQELVEREPVKTKHKITDFYDFN